MACKVLALALLAVGCGAQPQQIPSELQLLQLTAAAGRAVDFTVQVELKRRPFGPFASKTTSDHVTFAQGKLATCISTLKSRLETDLSASVTVTGAVGVIAGSGGTDEAHIFLMVEGLSLGSVTGPVQTAIESDLTSVGAGWGGAHMQTPTYVSGDSSSGMGSDQAASGTGDPHLTNMHGQRFDLYQPGVHVLIQVPRRAAPEDTLLRVEADARRMGGACADMYFQVLNITGNWTGRSGGLQFFASQEVENKDWRDFGEVGLKVVRGHTSEGIAYLNVFVKHLTRVKYSVGGLLGEDDHKAASTPGPECTRGVDLHAQIASVAVIEG